MLKRAFSMIELSVILIIISFLIAAVVGSGKLVQQSKLKKIMKEFKDYEIAARTFSVTYDLLPGDFNEASNFWSSCVDVGSNPCNGNADKILTKGYEHLRFWQHLSLAEIIGGNYTGANASGDDDETRPGENSPAGPFRNSCYTAKSLNSNWGIASDAAFVYGTAVADGICKNSVLTGLQASKIDSKLDDGAPNSGLLLARDGDEASGGDCVSSSAYVLSSETPKCYIAYLLKK